ncbi:MAG: alginate export family protein [Pseudomonadota bacterium]
MRRQGFGTVAAAVGALLGALAFLPAMAQETAQEAWSLDGLVRERATYQSAIAFDEDDPDAGWFWSQRISLTGRYQSEGPISGSVTLLSAYQRGIEDSPVERNDLDIQEGFLRFSGGSSWLQLGRQELILGSQRFLGSRDGTNVRRTWDGVRAATSLGDWQLQAFGVQLVDVESSGAFNDSSDSDRVIAGLYGTGALAGTGLDLYYLYSRFDDRATIEGVADQERHTIGARAFGQRDALFWNWEAAWQFGDHGDADIEAWTLATNTGLRLDSAWSPELMLSVNVASGDERRDDGELGTFDALYPRGNYFSELALLGPANFFNVNPYLRLAPSDQLAVSFDINWFWRLEEADGVYGPPGNVLRRPLGSDERFVNTAVSFTVDWTPAPNWLLGASFSYSRPEDFIQETGPADSTGFVQLTAQVSF